MAAIVTALGDTTITGLKLTYGLLPEDAKDMVEDMKALLNPRDNHSAYVATLKGSSNLPCIPFLGKHITY
jgi:hypothetical protein